METNYTAEKIKIGEMLQTILKRYSPTFCEVNIQRIDPGRKTTKSLHFNNNINSLLFIFSFNVVIHELREKCE